MAVHAGVNFSSSFFTHDQAPSSKGHSGDEAHAHLLLLSTTSREADLLGCILLCGGVPSSLIKLLSLFTHPLIIFTFIGVITSYFPTHPTFSFSEFRMVSSLYFVVIWIRVFFDALQFTHYLGAWTFLSSLSIETNGSGSRITLSNRSSRPIINF